jgi:cellulose synthase/poly-beta-1,6-N-acetylglucosamine synthase-like glycosyltransferase
VTVQLPIYNERYVVERLIDAACALDYPGDRLEIQVLDDSTDETAALARRRVAYHRGAGVDVRYVRRARRTGYKAGALAHGLERAAGEFVLVLDADFVPKPDLLRLLLPPFADPGVGMVQARWGHLNETASWLTRAQALILNAHFHIEHGARAAAGLFFNFNGTAGIWRVKCLREAGGWQSDTLTEDLDLSYRAQMKGWRFVFLPDVVVPGELPAEITSFKTQQARWAQGSMQTARKLLPDLLRDGHGWRVKLEAIMHLTSYMPSLLTLAVAVLVFPAAIVRLQNGWPLLLLAVLLYVPVILALGIGLSVNNARALLAGLARRGEPEFVRTPKRGSARVGYRPRNNWLGTAVESALAVYVAIAIAYALANGLYASIPFLLLFQYGFTAVAVGSMARRRNRAAVTVVT